MLPNKKLITHTREYTQKLTTSICVYLNNDIKY